MLASLVNGLLHKCNYLLSLAFCIVVKPNKTINCFEILILICIKIILFHTYTARPSTWTLNEIFKCTYYILHFSFFCWFTYFEVVGMECRVLHKLDKHSTVQLCSVAQTHSLSCVCVIWDGVLEHLSRLFVLLFKIRQSHFLAKTTHARHYNYNFAVSLWIYIFYILCGCRFFISGLEIGKKLMFYR